METNIGIIILIFCILVFLYWKKPFKKQLTKGRYIDIFNESTKQFLTTNTVKKRNYWILRRPNINKN